MNNAEARIRSFLERILRLKEDQDALGADIREVYKEAAGEGFNKTALGKVVTVIRAREKDADKLAALDADVALYLGAYDGTTIAPTRMRVTHTPHNPDTGEVIETAAAFCRRSRAAGRSGISSGAGRGSSAWRTVWD